MNVVIWILLWWIAGIIGNIMGYSFIDNKPMTWVDFKLTYWITFLGPFLIAIVLIVFMLTERKTDDNDESESR